MKTVIAEQDGARQVDMLAAAEDEAFHLNNLQLAIAFKIVPPPPFEDHGDHPHHHRMAA